MSVVEVMNGHSLDAAQGPLMTDTVEKVFSGWRTKLFSAAGASSARQREGPHRFTQKRSQTVVSVLRRLAAAETMKKRPSRDFRSRSIFDFFNSIDPKRTCDASSLSSQCCK